MVRSPSSENMGLKRGPWTAEEDQILVFHIQRYGHENWRALPKQAGLLRCGKSCRLRWTNYLRPDIKRGNFTTKEEETIIKLHEMLGNRWSAIAARLPGRTDNEIKNVWHTHLKKRLNPTPATQEPKLERVKENAANSAPTTLQSNTNTNTIHQSHADPVVVTSVSTSQSSGDLSCSGTDSPSVTRGNNWAVKEEDFVDFSSEQFLQLDQSFWRDALSLEDSGVPMDVVGPTEGHFFANDFLHDDYDMDSLLKVMADIGDLPEL